MSIPNYIVKVRGKLDLDQREAAEIFGGGINAFSRNEYGKAKPPWVLVKLLKMLDRTPLLVFIRRTRPQTRMNAGGARQILSSAGQNRVMFGQNILKNCPTRAILFSHLGQNFLKNCPALDK